MKKIIVLQLSLLLLSCIAVCQNRIITGTISDEKGAPAKNVSVKIAGTRTEIYSDLNGNYRLGNLPPNAALTFSAADIETTTKNSGLLSIMNVTVKSYKREIDVITLGAFGLRKKSAPVGRTTIDPKIITNGKPVNSNASDPNMRPEIYQSRMVSGIVTDKNNKPLEGISVKVPGSRASTATDSAGHYRILVFADTCSLLFEAYQMWPHKEPVADRTVINISLPVEDSELQAALRNYYESLIKKEQG